MIKHLSKMNTQQKRLLLVMRPARRINIGNVLINEVRTQVILKHVLDVSNKTIGELDKELVIRGLGGTKIVYQWARCETNIGKDSALALNKFYDGCLSLYDNPVWYLFNIDTYLTEKDVYQIMRRLIHRSKLGDAWKWSLPPVTSNSSDHTATDNMERMCTDIFDVKNLLKRCDEHGFTALLAAYRIAFYRGDMELCEASFISLFRAFPGFARVSYYQANWRKLLMLTRSVGCYQNVLSRLFTVDVSIMQHLIEDDNTVWDPHARQYEDPVIMMKHVPMTYLMQENDLWDNHDVHWSNV